MTRLNSFCLDVPGAPGDPHVNDLLSIVEGFGFPVVFAESLKGNYPCNSTNKWVGVTCSGANITVIDFKGMGLNALSLHALHVSELLKLSISLTKLLPDTFQKKKSYRLYTYIPEELTELRNLETLDVSYNHQLYDRYFHFGPNVVVVHGDPGIRYHVPPPVSGYLGSSSQNNNVAKILGSVIGSTVLVLLLIEFVIFLCVKEKKAYHKMHPQQHSGD
ncbi:hypothetical protein Bca52824_066523 [Brassica carinata]|uniref:Leucine-rich repeat-containing N-terminal plant-type domain-containing protein n=1 Tax=Brassica carinata TaxID=52824 RepID=A0A8X7QQN3_BRACI|nr:hypothetical protein Bca52824_066523 [Brassica carinata]